jgi:hypothetical protein
MSGNKKLSCALTLEQKTCVFSPFLSKIKINKQKQRGVKREKKKFQLKLYFLWFT